MTFTPQPLPPHLSESPKLGSEVSLTGKWIPKRQKRLFGSSPDSVPMRQALNELKNIGQSNQSVLTFELNDVVGADAVLLHIVFEDGKALVDFFGNAGAKQFATLNNVAVPDLHLLRGISVPDESTKQLESISIPVASGDFLFGYVKHDSRLPDLTSAIDVTAKWTCKPSSPSSQEELKHWWQQVGTDAFEMEKGLVRFEAFQVKNEDALIIHETFEDTSELKFHLTKGTAHKYKKSIDQIAVPERYMFRGPVSWLIRTYSKFMRLPATYSTRSSRYSKPGGNMSEGIAE